MHAACDEHWIAGDPDQPGTIQAPGLRFASGPQANTLSPDRTLAFLHPDLTVKSESTTVRSLSACQTRELCAQACAFHRAASRVHLEG